MKKKIRNSEIWKKNKINQKFEKKNKKSRSGKAVKKAQHWPVKLTGLCNLIKAMSFCCDRSLNFGWTVTSDWLMATSTTRWEQSDRPSDCVQSGSVRASNSPNRIENLRVKSTNQWKVDLRKWMKFFENNLMSAERLNVIFNDVGNENQNTLHYTWMSRDWTQCAAVST